MKLNQPKYVLILVLLVAVAIQAMIAFGKWLDLKESLAVFVSAMITAAGWYWSAYLNHRDFERSEFIKNKDKITSLCEKFFTELEIMMEKKGTTEKQIEDFVANKTAEISLKSTQLSRVFNANIYFLSTETIAELQNKPIDLYSENYEQQKQEMNALKTKTLEEIDSLYDNWLKSV